MPTFIYKPPITHSVATKLVARVLTTSENNNNNRQALTLNKTMMTIDDNSNDLTNMIQSQQPKFLFRDIMYFSLISLLLLLIVISIIFAQHLSRKLNSECEQMATHQQHQQKSIAIFEPLNKPPITTNASQQQQQQSMLYNNQQSISCELLAPNDATSSYQRHNAMLQRHYPSLTFQQAATIASIRPHQLQQQHQQHNLAPNQCVVSRSKSLANEQLIGHANYTQLCSCHNSIGRLSDLTAKSQNNNNTKNLIYHSTSISGNNDNQQQQQLHTTRGSISPSKFAKSVRPTDQFVSDDNEQLEFTDALTDDDNDDDDDDVDQSETINILTNSKLMVANEQLEQLNRRLSRQSMINCTRNDVPRHSMALTNTSSCLSCSNNNYNNHSNPLTCSYKSLISNPNGLNYYGTPRASISQLPINYARRVSEAAHRSATNHKSSQELFNQPNYNKNNNNYHHHHDHHHKLNKHHRLSRNHLDSSNKSLAISEQFIDISAATTTSAATTHSLARDNEIKNLRCTCATTKSDSEQQQQQEDLLPLQVNGIYHYSNKRPTKILNSQTNICQQSSNVNSNQRDVNTNHNVDSSGQCLFGPFKTALSSASLTTTSYTNQYPQQPPPPPLQTQQQPYKTTYAIGTTTSNSSRGNRLMSQRPRPHSANNKLIINPNEVDHFNRRIEFPARPFATATTSTRAKKKKRTGASSGK